MHKIVTTYTYTLANVLIEKLKDKNIENVDVFIINEADGSWEVLANDIYKEVVDTNSKFLFTELPYSKEDFDKVKIFIQLAKKLKEYNNIKIVYAVDENNEKGIKELTEAISNKVVDKFLIFCSYRDKVEKILNEIKEA